MNTAANTPETLESLIARLARTPSTLAEHVNGLDDAFVRRKRDGQLSILENIAHMRDLELEATTVRIRRILTEIDPALENFDGAAVVAAERYNEEPLVEALAAFTLGRRRNVARLQTLSNGDLDRRARIGGEPVTLGILLEKLCAHDDEHCSQVEHCLGPTAPDDTEIP